MKPDRYVAAIDRLRELVAAGRTSIQSWELCTARGEHPDRHLQALAARHALRNHGMALAKTGAGLWTTTDEARRRLGITPVTTGAIP